MEIRQTLVKLFVSGKLYALKQEQMSALIFLLLMLATVLNKHQYYLALPVMIMTEKDIAIKRLFDSTNRIQEKCLNCFIAARPCLIVKPC